MSLLRRSITRLRFTLARHPAIHWAVVAVAATVVGVGVHRQLDAAERARTSWGDTVEVVVATHDHGVGDPLRAEHRTLPVAATPPGALADVDSTERAVRPIGVGEVVLVADVTADPGPGALADPGTAVVPVADRLLPEPPIGIEVSIVADGIVLAERGRVVDRRAEVAFVSLPLDEAPAVAAAAQQGIASIVLRAPDPT